MNDKARAFADGLYDEASMGMRAEVCRLLGPALARTGKSLWLNGSMFGSDRAEGRSPYEFGSDATVGVATLAQIAGQLLSGAVTLLDSGNLYGALALNRQLVEAEYLASAFAEDQDQASSWLRSTTEERLSKWQPKKLRSRSNGQFRGTDYRSHCEVGGHPTPDAMPALPGHHDHSLTSFTWLELAVHGTSTWKDLGRAIGAIGLATWHVKCAESTQGTVLSEAIERWRTSDKALTAVRAASLEHHHQTR